MTKSGLVERLCVGFGMPNVLQVFGVLYVAHSVISPQRCRVGKCSYYCTADTAGRVMLLVRFFMSGVKRHVKG